MQFRTQAGSGAFLARLWGMADMAALNGSPAALLPLLLVPRDREPCLLLTQDFGWNTGSSSPSACRLWDRRGLAATMTPNTYRHPEAVPP